MTTLTTPSSGSAGHVADHTVLNDRHNRNSAVEVVAASGTARTLNVSSGGSTKDVTVNGNCTFTFTGALADEVSVLELVLRQDTTGSRLATWPASVKWAGGAPTLSTAAGSADRLVFVTYDGGGTWFGDLIGKGYA